ncbi:MULTISPECIES: ABC transporter substrate-binding protein [Prauserella salsuginis group]|uniref:Peptide/nickel transport system substrate-binding protein n=2 Tax=Prauserella salsuginis group TaxID=2893672 RepID=A0A839XSJ7_9PSEU|nr:MULTISPECIES: ABC transporter substrate-binding protein [Prauserella salsuginis group]MBB3666170.1 peptide/nickel transport system substrate-binding protein [Prauserella sediminis]MCR3722966.1 peptide/nickel transport system substrate-binding protein [Prauserella flava]MCR3737358.1 peptide/nickel transport system substrate-binding protein [Prauserella salsuginis]
MSLDNHDTRFSRRKFLLGSAALAGAVPFLSACGGRSDAAAAPTGPPKRGGTLRVGVTGGGASDTLDPHSPVTNPDIARVRNLYEPLVYRDHDFEVSYLVAEKLEPSADARTWTATLREGVRFHDGRPVTPADVVATFRRVMDPDDPKSGATSLSMLEKVTTKGDRQVEFHLNEPSAVFADYLGQYSLGIVPADFDLENPVGTGPFRAASFTAGLQSRFVRNPHYWRPGRPYLDELVLINFTEDDARINALLASQVDAIDQVPVSLVEVLRSDERMRILSSETGTWLPFTMRVDRPPFDDVRVRQALRLVIDREQMINQVLAGQGRVGNDLYAPFDPAYASELPQRTRNIAEARRLLAEAGKSNLDIELVTAPIQAGAVEAAQVFQQQAKAAGVNVRLRRVDTTTFYGDNYLKWDFAQDFWYTRNYLPQAANGSLPDSPYNETHWDDPEFVRLVRTANRTSDTGERTRLLKQAQRIEHERGGLIVWGFVNQVDAHQVYVAGLVPDRTGLPLSGYSFGQVWLG